MNQQEALDYQRIARAIEFIHENFKTQPDLEEIAEHVHLSPFHFQRLFTEWAGVSPKKFLQYVSISYAKSLLYLKQASLFDTAHATGLSGTGRLHDLFINIEAMTPGEYKNQGENLVIHYSYGESPFGKLLVASTNKGICHLTFMDDEKAAKERLLSQFPNALFISQQVDIHKDALSIFSQNDPQKIKLHLKGSSFQLKVWESLLKIPLGRLSTYGNIACQIHSPKASRAVGTAIGSNPVAYLIPCHRVIQKSGAFGGYMWGETRKSAIIGWEAAKSHNIC